MIVSNLRCIRALWYLQNLSIFVIICIVVLLHFTMYLGGILSRTSFSRCKVLNIHRTGLVGCDLWLLSVSQPPAQSQLSFELGLGSLMILFSWGVKLQG